MDSATLLSDDGPLGFGIDFEPSVPLSPFDPGSLDFSPSLPLDFGNIAPSAPNWGGDIGATYTPGQAAALTNEIREELTGAFTPDDWDDFAAAGITDLVETSIEELVTEEVSAALSGKTERRPPRPSGGGDSDSQDPSTNTGDSTYGAGNVGNDTGTRGFY